jgi:hypothetical protein
MCNADLACEKRLREDEIERMSQALHDLCQPLTTLLCRLELAGVLGTDRAYHDAVRLGLVECERLSEMVGSMRKIMWAATAEETVQRA